MSSCSETRVRCEECEDGGCVFAVEDVLDESETDSVRKDSKEGEEGDNKQRRQRKKSSREAASSSVSSTDSALGWGVRRMSGYQGQSSWETGEVGLSNKRVSRPSCVMAEVADRKISVIKGTEHENESILGQIHLELAKYHETERFDTSFHDTESALFHLRAAADCGNMQALVAICQVFTGRVNDILPAITQADAEKYEAGSIVDIGLDYVTTAARMGDTGSMVYLAEAYDKGLNLGTDRKQDFSQALYWYQKAAKDGAERGYSLLARAAEILAMPDERCFDPRLAAT